MLVGIAEREVGGETIKAGCRMGPAMSPPHGRAYFVDGERRVAAPIHAHWFTGRGILELNEKLRAPPVTLRIREISRELTAAQRALLTAQTVRLAREVMAALFRETRPMIERHMLNYPLPELDPERFASPTGRAASERYLTILRAHDATYRPRSLSRYAAVPPIVIVGTNRSAESLRMHALSTRQIAWNQLENQRGNAHADYCLDLTAIGSDTTLNLLDYWWDGKTAAADHGLQEAYDTLFHEPLHRMCDLTNPFGPQYGPKGGAKEHYWMEEYEPFAGQVERVLVAHLSEGRERGLLRKRILDAR